MKCVFKYGFCIVVGLLLTLASCQKVIHLDLKDAPPVLVIDADMSNVNGLRVRLSKSVGFYDDNIFPAVDSGAVVVLKNLTTEHVDTVPMRRQGLYVLDRKPNIGTSYQLFVTVDSITYTAISTMPEVTVFDSITFSKRNLFGDDIISARVNFQDKPGVDNYYLFRQALLKNGKQSVFPFSDRLSDGRYIRRNCLNDSSYINIGDTVAINMQCIDKNVYKYFDVLGDVSGEGGGFGNASPANPPTNIVGGALGVFNVHSDYMQKVKVPDVVETE